MFEMHLDPGSGSQPAPDVSKNSNLYFFGRNPIIQHENVSVNNETVSVQAEC